MPTIKGFSLVIRVGAKVKNIHLAEDEHNIDRMRHESAIHRPESGQQ